MKCNLCSHPKTDLIEVNYAFFRHYDFAIMKKSGCFRRCSNCQIVFNPDSDNSLQMTNNLFQNRAYSLSKQTEQTFVVSDYANSVTRSFLQVKLLSEFLNKGNISVLDIGCFDGKMLTEFDSQLQCTELHGFDVNGYVNSFFPGEDKYHFWTSDLENVEGKFDLICMSHSIQYIKDISHLMRNLKRLIKPDGKVFVQVADISESPLSILLGDQYYYYTFNILKNVFQSGAFNFYPLDNRWFPREIVGIAEPISKPTDDSFIEDLNIYSCVEYLNEVNTKMNEISDVSKLRVLGTTISAAFVNSILGDKIDYFVDESPGKINSLFHNKKVLHPSSLDSSDTLIIPFKGSSRHIEMRLSKKCSCKFICI